MLTLSTDIFCLSTPSHEPMHYWYICAKEKDGHNRLIYDHETEYTEDHKCLFSRMSAPQQNLCKNHYNEIFLLDLKTQLQLILLSHIIKV